MLLEERELIKKYLDEGLSIYKITKILGGAKSRIWTEVNRNSVNGVYDPFVAQQLAVDRRSKNRILVDQEKEERIFELLKKGGSIKDVAQFSNTTETVVRRLRDQEKGMKKQISESVEDRISALEMQVQILTETVKELYVHFKNH